MYLSKRRMVSRVKMIGVIGTLLLFALSCYTANAAEVKLRPNPKDSTATDIYTTDSKTGKLMKILTLDRVYRDHYHPAEYRNGNLYIIRRVGPPETNPNWTDELWRCNSGKETKLWASRGLDFRVNNDGSRIAVLTRRNTVNPESLYLLDSNGKELKKIAADYEGVGGVDLVGWSGRYVWIKQQPMIEIFGLLKVDTSNMIIERFDLEQLKIVSEDFAVNTTTHKIAYSDHPFFFDVDSCDDFIKSKKPVRLYVYDLRTKTRKMIAQSTAKAFAPKWVGENVLEYNNPTGKGRVRKTIR